MSSPTAVRCCGATGRHGWLLWRAAHLPAGTRPPRGIAGGDKRIDPGLVWGDLGLTPVHPDALAELPELVRQG